MALYGGLITTTKTNYVCYDTPIHNLTELIAVSGGTAPYTYDWEYQLDYIGAWNSTGVNNINLTSFPSYFKQTRCYRRKVTDSALTVAYSNTITLTLNNIQNNITGVTFTDIRHDIVSATWNNYFIKGTYKDGFRLDSVTAKIYSIDSGDTHTIITTGELTGVTFYNLLPNTIYNLYLESYGVYECPSTYYLTQVYKTTFTTNQITFGNLMTSYNHGNAGWSAIPIKQIIDSNDNIYYYHGSVTYNGINVNKKLSRVNAITAALDTGYNTTLGSGFSSALLEPFILLQNNKILANTNNNTTFNGITIQNKSIVRLNSNGTLDTTFLFNNLGKESYALYVDNGEKIIAFKKLNLANHNGVLFRLNADGTVDNTFKSGIEGDDNLYTHTNGIIQDGNGKYIRVGSFTTYSGVTANRIVKLNYDGTIDSTFNSGTGFNNTVYNVAIDNNNKIYCTGVFTSYSGVTANRIIRLNTDGTIDSTFNTGTGFNGGTIGLFVDFNGKILIGGLNGSCFTDYNGTTANGIIRLNSDGSIDTTFKYGTGIKTTGGSLIFATIGDFIPDSKGNILTRFNGYYDDNLMLTGQIAKLYSNSTFPTPFCTALPFTISGSTCGNNDGKISITDYSYFGYYDFTLTDVLGNSYTFNANGEATGLTSNYYFFTATVKPEYWYYYGRETCTFDWIKIEDSDNPAFLVGVSVKPQQCQPFDRQFGRIFYNVSGLTSGHTYSFYAFTSDFSLYYSETGITSTNSFILANADSGCYWVLIRDEISGCAVLIDNRCVPSLNLFSQGGIKKLFIAKWTDDLDYNYWSTADEDYFLEFEDTSFFTSTKIKEYFSASGGTGCTWYSLPVFENVCKLSQKLDKVRQGYIFTDTLTLAVNHATAMKWEKMRNVLNPENKWIFILLDENNFWWTGGYRHGARITVYKFQSGARGEDNGYSLEIQAVSENKILTAIDENYINTKILD